MEHHAELEKLKTDIRRRLERYVVRTGIQFNPDADYVDQVITGLAMRQQKHGRAYCPCRMPTGDRKEDAKLTCPCRWHREEIERDGTCRCKLFVAPDFEASSGESHG